MKGERDSNEVKTFIGLDVETTGLHASRDRIIEIALCYVKDGEAVGTWSRLINPGRPIPEVVTKITGIASTDVRHLPTFADIADEISKRLDGQHCVAHNSEFDSDFVAAEFERLGIEAPTITWHCSLNLAQSVLPYAARHTLAHVSALCGVVNPNAHRAAPDAATAAAVWQKLAAMQSGSHHCGVSTRENAAAERLAWELDQCGVELHAGVESLEIIFKALPKHATQSLVTSTVGEYRERLQRVIATSDVSPCPVCGAQWRHRWQDEPQHAVFVESELPALQERLW